MKMTRTLFTNPERFYDIIVAGGGMVGCTMACSLGKNSAFRKYKIGVLEGSKERSYNGLDKYSNRVSSVNNAAKNLLTNLGVWKNIRRTHPVKDMKVWGSFSDKYTHFTGGHDEALAFIVENDEIINAALTELNNLSNVDVIYNAKIKSVHLEKIASENTPEVTLHDGTSYSCKLLIGADGLYSKIREAMCASQISWNYNQSAIVATLHINSFDKKNHTAWQRFLLEGPIALLPLSDEMSSLVWGMTPQKAKRLIELPGKEFVDELNEFITSSPIRDSTVDFLGNATKLLEGLFPSDITNLPTLKCPKVTNVEENSRAMFPLTFAHATQYVAPQVVIIGDAAHRVNPLAGQGVNIGFRDAKTLTNSLLEGLTNGRGLGDYEDLKNYESRCQKSNLPLITTIDVLHRIYTSKFGLTKVCGDLGFLLTEMYPMTKDIMKTWANR